MSPSSLVSPDTSQFVIDLGVHGPVDRRISAPLQAVVADGNLVDVRVDGHDLAEAQAEEQDAVCYFRPDATEA